MPKYLRHGPHGFCSRCGFKYYLSEFREDGDMDGVYVCSTCYEEENPQKYPVDISGEESVLHFTLPPDETDTTVINVGTLYDVDTLAPIVSEPSLITSGKAEIEI